MINDVRWLEEWSRLSPEERVEREVEQFEHAVHEVYGDLPWLWLHKWLLRRILWWIECA